MDKEISVKFLDNLIYGVNWDATDEEPDKEASIEARIKEKPFCEIEGCTERVSTEFGRPKPYCKDHVFENPYVKDLVKRLEALDDAKDQKAAKCAFEKLKKELGNETL